MGPVLETYRGNRVALGAATLVALLSLAGLVARYPHPLDFLGVLGICLFVALRGLGTRVTIHAEGLRSKSLLRTQEIL